LCHIIAEFENLLIFGYHTEKFATGPQPLLFYAFYLEFVVLPEKRFRPLSISMPGIAFNLNFIKYHPHNYLPIEVNEV
jgi:hypothetical protein